MLRCERSTSFNEGSAVRTILPRGLTLGLRLRIGLKLCLGFGLALVPMGSMGWAEPRAAEAGPGLTRASQGAQYSLPRTLATRQIEIRWRAQLPEAEGRFVLYAGSGGELRPLRRISPRSEPGSQAVFHARETVLASGPRTYELRFEYSQGHEVVLATTRVQVEKIEPMPASWAPSTGIALVVVDSLAGEELALGLRLAPERAWAFSQTTLRPPSPPPRPFLAA